VLAKKEVKVMYMKGGQWGGRGGGRRGREGREEEGSGMGVGLGEDGEGREEGGGWGTYRYERAVWKAVAGEKQGLEVVTV